MKKFTIFKNEFLQKCDIKGFYHTDYVGYENLGNPDYLNDLKNTFNNFSKQKLENAVDMLYNVLKKDLEKFDRNLTICIVPRAKAEKTYSKKQLLFKKVVQYVIKEFGFKDGSDYIIRHTDTKTTHLAHTNYAGDGDLPYPGITKATCFISKEVKGKNILLIDDIYTHGVNIDEDVIQALFDNGANNVIFYAVAKTKINNDFLDYNNPPI